MCLHQAPELLQHKPLGPLESRRHRMLNPPGCAAVAPIHPGIISDSDDFGIPDLKQSAVGEALRAVHARLDHQAHALPALAHDLHMLVSTRKPLAHITHFGRREEIVSVRMRPSKEKQQDPRYPTGEKSSFQHTCSPRPRPLPPPPPHPPNTTKNDKLVHPWSDGDG